MEYYSGIDVSLKESSVCVVDVSGKVVREVKVGDATVRTAPQLPAFRNFHVSRKSA